MRLVKVGILLRAIKNTVVIIGKWGVLAKQRSALPAGRLKQAVSRETMRNSIVASIIAA
jgi:hypothetical protein